MASLWRALMSRYCLIMGVAASTGIIYSIKRSDRHDFLFYHGAMKKTLLALLLILTCPCLGLCEASEIPPFYKTIMKIIGPLEYSGVPVMVKPQVTLSVDFDHGTWTLHNIHEYDSQGRIVLEGGRFGLCAELATFTFEKIKPLLDGRYEVKFAMVTESGFFAAGQSNHIVLLLGDKADKQIYLIDPSFHKYARLKDLPEYQVQDIKDTLSFVKDRSHDISFNADQAIPLYIKNDFLLSFSVTSVDGKFDRGNFIFVISAMRRYKFAGRDIVVIGRRKRRFEDFEDRRMLNDLLTPDEIKILFDKLKSWIAGFNPSSGPVVMGSKANSKSH